MFNLKKITLITFLIIIYGCGYTPLYNEKRNNFYISEINTTGDRQVNNNIVSYLKKFQKKQENSNEYELTISTDYGKYVVDKDNKGNPKNYNIKIKTSVVAKSANGDEINKTFERGISLAAKSKKIDERELESKHKKDISNLIGKDIIFLLTTNK